MSSTLKEDESGEPLHVQQRRQSDAFRKEWEAHDHGFEPRVSVSRSIVAITSDTDRRYFLGGGERGDQFGNIEPGLRAVFGRSYAAEPDELVEQLRGDEAVEAADTLLITVPTQLGVEYNAHLLESILTHVAPELGWR